MADANKGFVPALEKTVNNTAKENDGFTPPTVKELNQKGNDFDLKPVSPGSAGEGLPYAPTDWPNPGDNWRWKVGKRISPDGYYRDRYLYLPKHFPKYGRNYLDSKSIVVRYIKEKFPGVDVDTFFSSFSWRIPSRQEHVSTQEETKGIGKEGKQETHCTSPKEGKQLAAASSSAAPKRRAAADSAARPKQKVTTISSTTLEQEAVASLSNDTAEPSTEPISLNETPAPEDEIRSTTQRKGKWKAAASSLAAPKRKAIADSSTIPKQKAAGSSSATFEQKARSTSSARPKRKACQPFEQQASSNNDTGGIQTTQNWSIHQEEFDKHLNLLNGATAKPSSEHICLNDTPAPEHEIIATQFRLSSVLNDDFPSIFQSKMFTELAKLASTLRKDPNLSAEQLVKLKLIEEIPSYSEVFLENKEVLEQADKFFESLKAMEAKAAILMNKDRELKEKVMLLQTNIDHSLLVVQEINNQIALLQCQRDRLANIIDSMKKRKVVLVADQNVLADSIPGLEQRIQFANSERPEWELKKENATKREAEILDKFVPLKWFCASGKSL